MLNNNINEENSKESQDSNPSSKSTNLFDVLRVTKKTNTSISAFFSTTKPSQNSSNKVVALNSFQKKIFNSLNIKMVSCCDVTKIVGSNLIRAIITKNKYSFNSECEKGLPEDLPMLRAIVWKIHLNYLSIDSWKWEETLSIKRAQYNVYKLQLKEKLHKEFEGKNFRYKAMFDQITKDVYRTDADLSFFFHPTNKKVTFTPEKVEALYKKRKNLVLPEIDDIYMMFEENDVNENETHADVLIRLLFINSVFNPDISYHQGMHEILAPIYYCFSYDKTYIEENETDIEADTFWCFYLLMHQIRSSFDDSVSKNVSYLCSNFNKCLEIIDKDIYDHLVNNKIRNEYYCYRWFIVLFTQDFFMHDKLKLWDFILSKENKYYYIYYFGLAYLFMFRNEIMNGGLCEIMTIFQDSKNIDIDKLIYFILYTFRKRIKVILR